MKNKKKFLSIAFCQSIGFFGSTTNVRVPNVRVEKHQSGQTQESQTSEWDKRQSGTNVRVDKRRIFGTNVRVDIL